MPDGIRATMTTTTTVRTTVSVGSDRGRGRDRDWDRRGHDPYGHDRWDRRPVYRPQPQPVLVCPPPAPYGYPQQPCYPTYPQQPPVYGPAQAIGGLIGAIIDLSNADDRSRRHR